MKSAKAKTPVAVEHLLRFGVKFCESVKEGGVNESTREVPVYIISEGPGNKVDRNFYTREALQESFQRFDGAKCYADHPSKIDESSRPERSIRDIVGYFHTPQFVEVGGIGKIKAVLKINQGDSFQWAWDMLKEALAYADKYADKDYVGISINADGVTHPGEDAQKEPVNFVDSIRRVVSADMVTQPAAGGKPLRESARVDSEGRADKGGLKSMDDMMMKAAEALKMHRAEVAKNPEHEAMYGPALDEMAKYFDMPAKKDDAAAEPDADEKAKLALAAKEREMAPPPDKDGQLEPEKKKEESEDEVYAAESERYRVGKMNPNEKRMFEALSSKRAELALIESDKMVSKKLAESGLPEAVCGDLRLILRGKDEKYCDQMVTARKNMMESIVGNRATGAGAKGGSESPNKLKDNLASAGVPLKA